MAVLRLINCEKHNVDDADVVAKNKYQQELVQQFGDIVDMRYANGTRATLNSALNHYLPWLQERKLWIWDVKPNVYDQFSKHLQINIKNATVVHYNTYLSNMYDWLVSRKKDDIYSLYGTNVVNPIDQWNTPKRPYKLEDLPELPNNEVVHYYLQREKKALKDAIESCDNRKACILARQLTAEYIMLLAGLRIAEVANLNVGSISFKDMLIIVKHGKGDKDRIVDMPGDLGKMLKWYIENAHIYTIKGRKIEAKTPLFLSEQNKKISKKTMQHRLWMQQQEYNVPIDQYFSPHGLRRLYATNLYKKLIDEKHPDPLTYIKIQLGHVFYSTTLKYCRVDEAIVSRSTNNAISSVRKQLLGDDM